MRPNELPLFSKSSLLLLLGMLGCSGRQDFYHGYVYDVNNLKPLPGVLVKEDLFEGSKSTYTDKTGYFKIPNHRQPYSNLIFSIKGYRTDTMLTIWSQHGEKLNYSFINKNTDTVFLRPKITNEVYRNSR